MGRRRWGSGKKLDSSTTKKIGDVLKKYPFIEKILPPPALDAKLRIDQYGGNIPSTRVEDISESTIYEVLLSSEKEQFIIQLDLLNQLLSCHKAYQTKEFGEQLASGFFSHLSEIEIYDALIRKGIIPEIEYPISNCKDTKTSDFKIEWDGAAYFIEVTTPRMSLSLEKTFCDPLLDPLGGCGFYDQENGLLDSHSDQFHPIERKIISKYEKFEPEGPDFPFPIIIVINMTYAHFGSPNLGKIFQKKRFHNFFHGVLSYQTIFHYPDYRYRCHFYDNPQLIIKDKERRFFNTLLCE